MTPSCRASQTPNSRRLDYWEHHYGRIQSLIRKKTYTMTLTNCLEKDRDEPADEARQQKDPDQLEDGTLRFRDWAIWNCDALILVLLHWGWWITRMVRSGREAHHLKLVVLQQEVQVWVLQEVPARGVCELDIVAILPGVGLLGLSIHRQPRASDRAPAGYCKARSTGVLH